MYGKVILYISLNTSSVQPRMNLSVVHYSYLPKIGYSNLFLKPQINKESKRATQQEEPLKDMS
jgi:hypothetical protein